jgi:DNA-directed RNA polymerase specialized sigma24 family protein
MTALEPARDWQDRQHRLVVQNRITAFAELCEIALPHISYYLQTQFPQFDPHMHHMVAADALLAYQKRPSQYDPEKLSLFAFLRMAARRDFLNAIDKKRRLEQRLTDIDDPAVQTTLSEDPVDDLSEAWLQQYTDLTTAEFLDAFICNLSEDDRQIFALILNGERATEPYAALMGLTDLSVDRQRQEVKRAKDRLMTRLRRFAQTQSKP